MRKKIIASVLVFIVILTVAIVLSPRKAKAASFDLIKTSSKPEIYVNVPWGRYHIRNIDTWNRWGFSWDMVRTISDEEMRSIPQGPEITRALRPFGDPTVYVVENGQFRAVTSADSFVFSGYSWGDISDVEPAIINKLPRGSNLETPPVLRSPKDGKIYYLWGGQKHHITNPFVWNQWGFTSYVDSAAVDSIPTGSPLTTLVRPYGDPTVWVIDHGQRRALPSPDALILNGYSWGDIVDADNGLIASRPVGDIFWAPTTVRAPGSDSIYYVDNGVKYLIKDTDTWNHWGFDRFGSAVTPVINSYPSGPVLSRLIRTEDGTIWRVKDSQIKAVPSVGVFNGYGFSWSDVSGLPITSLWPLPNGGVLEYIVSSLNGISIPAERGKTGREQHLWTTRGEESENDHYAITNVPADLRNGIAGTGAFGRIDAGIEQYYIAMRWNYCNWTESGSDPNFPGNIGTICTSSNSGIKNWHYGKKVIVSNPANGKKIVVAVGEAGPAIWVTNARGVVSGLSPEATAYIVGSKYGANGDNLEYGWSVDQTLPLGPLSW